MRPHELILLLLLLLLSVRHAVYGTFTSYQLPVLDMYSYVNVRSYTDYIILFWQPHDRVIISVLTIFFSRLLACGRGILFSEYRNTIIPQTELSSKFLSTILAFSCLIRNQIASVYKCKWWTNHYYQNTKQSLSKYCHIYQVGILQRRHFRMWNDLPIDNHN